jgi:hypothetical protein
MIKMILRLFGLRKSRAPNSELLRRKESISEAKTDRSRWEESVSFEENWSGRAELAAAMIKGSKKVCDIGCGMQDLRRELEDHVQYLPMDIVKWSPDTLECEINQKNLPLEYIRAAEVTTILGVVEYLNEPRWLLQRIAENCPALLVSYCTAQPSGNLQKRVNNGWMNSFSDIEFESLLGSLNWKIIDKRLYEGSQWLWLCRLSSNKGN